MAVGTEPDNSDIQSNPKQGNMYVTATIAENTPPTTPILIAPTNNSYITVNPPTFIWEKSTDNYGIDYYQLWLDGELLFDHIPTSSTENSDYTLTFNSSTGRYTLVPKLGFDQGSHTWKISVFDIYHGAHTDSATWNFTIDTQAPSFVITQIGDQLVSISAQDPTTIPIEPIELTDNEPIISATGEADSTVILTVTIPGDPTQTYTVNIDSSGNWSKQLPTLPRNVEITLDFTITDKAGNVSVLTGVKIIIVAQTIVIPPPTGTPIATPGAPIEPVVSPSPAITIPILPPIEYGKEIIQEIIEKIPSPISQIVTALPKQIEEAVINTLQKLTPSLSVVATVAVPAISLLSLLYQFGWDFFWKIILKLLQAIGLLPKKKPQGLVFNSITQEPVAFALLTVKSYPFKNDTDAIQETVITDTDGIYQGLKLPKGQYTMTVSHQDYIFPTTKKRPAYLPFQDFYKGEIFDAKSSSDEQLFLIPVDPIDISQQKYKFKALVRLILARIRLKSFTIPLFVFSLIVALFFPSIINWIIVGIYIVILIRQFIAALKIPSISGEVIDQNGVPVENAIIRISTPDTNQLVSIIYSDRNGNFGAFVDKGVYQIDGTKTNYVWTNKGTSITLKEIDTRVTSQYLIIQMTEGKIFYKDLFFEN